MKKITDLGEKEVIHCTTQQEAISICQLIHDAGIGNRDSILSWPYDDDYYNMYKGHWGILPNGNSGYASHTEIEFYQNQGYKIYPASDFLPPAISYLLPKQFQVYAATEEEAQYLADMQEKLGYSNGPSRSNGYFQFNNAPAIWSRDKETVEEISLANFKDHFKNVDNWQWLVGRMLPAYRGSINRAYSKDAKKRYSIGSTDGLYEGKEKILNVTKDWYDTLVVQTDDVHDAKNGFWYIPITELYRCNIMPEPLVNNNTNTQSMEKEIIGYRLKDEYKHLEKVASDIAERATSTFNMHPNGYHFGNGTSTMNLLEKAGVLDIWFEPVYKEEEPKFKVGDYIVPVTPDSVDRANRYTVGSVWKVKNIIENDKARLGCEENSCWIAAKDVRLATKEEIAKVQIITVSMNGQFDLTIRDKKVYHMNEDITDYVKGLVSYFNGFTNKIGNYDAILDIGSIKFTKCGCETRTVYLTDWLRVYNLIR